MYPSNKELRNTTIFVGFCFLFVNAVLCAIWFFEPEQDNKTGVLFVWVLLDVVFSLGCFVVFLAHRMFPIKDDDGYGDNVDGV